MSSASTADSVPMAVFFLRLSRFQSLTKYDRHVVLAASQPGQCYRSNKWFSFPEIIEILWIVIHFRPGYWTPFDYIFSVSF